MSQSDRSWTRHSVGILASSATCRRRVERLLPGDWRVVPIEVSDFPHETPATITALVVSELSMGSPDVCRTLDLFRMECPAAPIILLTAPGPASLWTLANLAGIDPVVSGIEDDQLPAALRRVRPGEPFRSMAEKVSSVRGADPLLRRALLRAVLQAPPSPPEATEMMAKRGSPFIRSVDQLAGEFGCGRGYLSRRASDVGFALKKFLRWITFLRGLSLHLESGDSWGRVAVRLGFQSCSAWNHFVNRLVGRNPTMAARVPMEVWLEAFWADFPAIAENCERIQREAGLG